MSNPYAPPSSDRSGGPTGSRRTDGPGRRTPDTDGPDTEGPHAETSTAAGRSEPAGGGPGPGHGPGHGARPRPGQRTGPGPTRPLDAGAVQLASRRVMHFGLAMLATLVTATLPLPWQAAGLAFAVMAIALGVRALRTVWVSGVRGTLVPVLAVGLVFATLMTVSLGTMLALWPLQMERQDCLRDALTITATEACETQFQEGLTQRLDQMGQRSGD